MEQKNIFAPSTTGRGAMRRAAMLLLVMLLTMAQTAWAADETKTFTVSSVTGSGNPLSYDGKTFISATGNEKIQNGS